MDSAQHVRDLLTPPVYVVFEGQRHAVIPGPECRYCAKTGYMIVNGAPPLRGNLRTQPGCIVCRRDPLQWTNDVIRAKIVAGEVAKNPQLAELTGGRPQHIRHDHEFQRRVQILHLCDGCNKESEVPAGQDNGGITATFYNCPHCGKRLDVWVKVHIGTAQ